MTEKEIKQSIIKREYCANLRDSEERKGYCEKKRSQREIKGARE